jgi:CRP-like cAMP-binding protein
VRVTASDSATAEERELIQLGPGEHFGEMALMNNEPRAANVCALEEGVSCYTLGQEDFVELLGPLRDVLDHHMAVRVLRGVPLLASLSGREMEEVARSLQTVSFNRGERVICEGEDGEVFYIIKEGEVAVTQWSRYTARRGWRQGKHARARPCRQRA